mmetsp:Transcript_29086/g.93800  ORF Transcript_29086/g.93800 Transcript_29086/m.93800 type:complete len:256 (-) Transcript_29086:48-815(-)
MRVRGGPAVESRPGGGGPEGAPAGPVPVAEADAALLRTHEHEGLPAISQVVRGPDRRRPRRSQPRRPGPRRRRAEPLERSPPDAPLRRRDRSLPEASQRHPVERRRPRRTEQLDQKKTPGFSGCATTTTTAPGRPSYRRPWPTTTSSPRETAPRSKRNEATSSSSFPTASPKNTLPGSSSGPTVRSSFNMCLPAWCHSFPFLRQVPRSSSSSFATKATPTTSSTSTPRPSPPSSSVEAQATSVRPFRRLETDNTK